MLIHAKRVEDSQCQVFQGLKIGDFGGFPGMAACLYTADVAVSKSLLGLTNHLCMQL